MKILLIEPDRVLAATYKQYLEDQGYEVSLSSTSRAAATAIDDNIPDLILIEIQLAGHNGIEFLYEIRSYNDTRSVPAIALTQVHPSKFAADPRQLDLLGLKKYLYKPETKLADIKLAIDSVIS